MEKELLKFTVVQQNNSLVAKAEYDEQDDVFGNLAFVFIGFCKNMDMPTKEALKYLKQSIDLWEKYGDYENANTNS